MKKSNIIKIPKKNNEYKFVKLQRNNKFLHKQKLKRDIAKMMDNMIEEERY